MDPAARPTSPARFLNDFLGVRAFERGDAVVQHVPLEVHLQLSSTCNLDCVMCVEHLHPPEERRKRRLEFLPAAVFDRLEAEVLPGASRLKLGVGGEALLCPDFFDYAERARRLGVKGEVLTNGTLITSDEIAARLVRCLSSIQISIDGATAEIYERIRRGASFDRVVEGIESMQRYRLELPEEERPHLGFCAVLMDGNVHELPRLVELAARLGVDRVSAAHVVPMTPEGRAQSLFEQRDRSDRYVLEACARGEELGVEVDLPRPFRSEDAQRVDEIAPAESRVAAVRRREDLGSAPEGPARLACHMPTLAVYVLVDGRVYPCGHPLVHQREPLGDLTRSSFAEIWNGREFRNLRAGLARGDAPRVCRTCSLMHNPPPVPESPDEHGRPGASLVARYQGRDLAPFPSNAGLAALPNPEMQARLGETLREVLADRDRAQRESEELHRSREAMHRQWHEDGDASRERAELRAHIAALEEERAHLVGHVANLERMLDRIHGRRIYATLCRVKDLFKRPGERRGPGAG